jgi:hypothetical protein
MSIPSDERTTLARHVLIEILRENGPQLGAKLKVRLSATLGRRLGLPPDQWHRLIPRLSNFLAAHSDLVEVQRPAGPGDIRVSLRPDSSQALTAEIEPTRIWYRPDVWTAVVNPDRQRRRFFHRRNHELVHFVDQGLTPPNPELARRVAGDPSFVEIRFADADTQNRWMREFLETTPLISEAHKRIARHFVEVPFDSSLNVAFAAALGPHAEAWKRFRARKVDDQISNWARTNGIDLEALKTFPIATGDATPALVEAPPALPRPKQATTERAGDLRSTLRGIVDSLEDSELPQVLIPLSAVNRILRLRS